MKDEIRRFWNSNPCGSDYIPHKVGTRQFYEESEKLRYKNHYYLPSTVRFDRFKGKKVLEIGVGIGIDAKQFAQGGAIYTGIDLTPNAVNITKKLFSTYKLKGKVLVADAENLPFPDKSFDLVYSCGVLHHTPKTDKAIDEVFRVLKPGGEAIIMLYCKSSWHYVVEIFLYRYLLRLGFLRYSFQQMLNVNSDGKGNPLSRAYRRSELTKLFRRFREPRFTQRYLELPKFIYNNMPRRMNLSLSKMMGWHVFTFAKK